MIDAVVHLFAELSRRWSLVFLLGFLTLGAMSTAAIPAFQVPDEPAHWWVGLRRANALFGGSPAGVCGAAVALPSHMQVERVRWGQGHLPFHLARGLEAVPGDCTAHTIPYGTVTTYPSVVLGYPVFFAAAQRSGVAAFFYLTFARLLAGFLIAGMLWRALRAWTTRGPTPGAATLVVFFWSPLFVQQAFAVTSDTVMVLFVLALITVCLRFPTVPRLDLGLLVLFGLTATFTKPTIAPVALVPALWVLAACLPSAPWRRGSLDHLWRRLRRDRIAPFLLVTSVSLVLSAFMAFAGMGGSEGVGILDGARQPASQMADVQAHPLASLSLFVSTIRQSMSAFELNGILGWMDTALPHAQAFVWRDLLRGALVLDGLFAVALLVQAGERDWRRQLWRWLVTGGGILVGAAVSMVAVALAMYVANTTYGATQLEGLQPRYLFPSLLVAAFAFAALRVDPAGWPAPRVTPPGWFRPAAVVGQGAILVAVGFAWVAIFTHLYLTLWGRYW